jgi:membrane associated rhomboid family serine protease
MPDRSFSRNPAPAWMRPITERLPPTIRNLVIVQAVMFGLYILANPLREPISSHLALGYLLATGELWQPATSLFIHMDLWNFLFDMIGLWFVGATIERALGRRRFLLLFFGCGLAANAVAGGLMVWLKWPSVYAGCGDPVLALFIALGVLYGQTQVRVFGQLVLQARILTAILVGISVLVALAHASWPSLAGTLVAISLGYFLSGGKGKDIAAFLSQFRRKRSGLHVLEGGRNKGGKKYVN